MKIISWNIRGLGSNLKKKRFLSKLVKHRKPDVLFIQESKLENVEQAVIQRIWGNPDVGFSISSSEGASGGLLTLWNSEIFKPHAITSHKHFILVEGTQGNGFQCVFLNIYICSQ